MPCPYRGSVKTCLGERDAKRVLWGSLAPIGEADSPALRTGVRPNLRSERIEDSCRIAFSNRRTARSASVP